MKSMFSNQIFSREVFSAPPPIRSYAAPRRVLGQTDYVTVDEGYRAKYLTKVGEAMKKLPALNDVVALSSDMSLYRSFMEPDSAAFLQLSNEAAALYPTVRDMYNRFQSDSAEQYYASPAEMDASELWTRKVDEMYRLFLVHFPQQPIPGVVKPGPVQTAVTATGVPKPVTAGTPAAALPGAPAAATLLGMNTNNLLIGGGLAVALGVLIYAVS